jgi:anaerobic selenocysteine-containing dehydrogenase
LGWDAALGWIEEKVRSVRHQFGPEAILPISYGGSNGMLSHEAVDFDFFKGIGASRLNRAVCANPTTAAATGLYGRMGGVDLVDYKDSRLIVVWGANPSASGIHLVPVIQSAVKSGAGLVVVDPRRTNLAKKADLHLQLRPGTDLPVALSVIHWLFETGKADLEFLKEHATGVEELRRRAKDWTIKKAAQVSGVPEQTMLSFAELYAESSPAVVRCGWGLERNRNGGSAVAAVLALPAVAGKFGVRGGGYTMSNSGVWKVPGCETEAKGPQPREINMNRLGRALVQAEPPVKLLFVYNANPAATLPNQKLVVQGLEREDLLTVVFDQVATDTALYADLVLPATTFLEHHDLATGYGATVLHQVHPVIPPVGEARSNFEVFSALSRRLGLQPASDLTANGYAAKLLGASRQDRLERDGILFPTQGFGAVQFVDIIPQTENGKICLLPADIEKESRFGMYRYLPDPGTSEYPLALISPATSRTTNSTFGQLYRRQAHLEIHPESAASRGIENEDQVLVYNSFGEVHCFARLTDNLPLDTVALPKGLWRHNTLNGWTSNALSPDSLTDIGAGACFNDARVEVRKV